MNLLETYNGSEVFGVSPRYESVGFDDVIDEIDRVPAAHSGFTDEELDFIINYDVR